MKVKLLTIVLCLTVSLAAQQRRVVRIGAGQDPEATKDWPKIAAKGQIDALGPYLDSLVARDLFSGTVLVARQGRPLFFKSYGFANKDWSVPNTNDTKYNIGSINKIFTKAALMQLRDEGKLDFSKALRTYLQDYPSEIADRITIAQLMEHSSGMGDFFGPDYMAAPKDRVRTLNDFVPFFAKKPLELEPGKGKRYSNAGFIVLGLVIEKLSGMSYHDYVKAKIFAPLEMNDTGHFPADEVLAKRAVGYTKSGKTNTFSLPGRSSSAGGGYSTANDLLRFATSARKVLSAAAFEELIGANPGVGWGGGSGGVNAAVELEGRYTIVVLSNYDPPAAEEVARNVRTLLGLGGE